jgi:NAD(P)-dependent dehydrogenase (short-subunit alcohol dehydrogenase family)
MRPALDIASVTMAFAIYPSLKDKRVVVTGGASGIGAEIVRSLNKDRASDSWISTSSTAQRWPTNSAEAARI